ncbi:PREDICTED: probable arginine--tRNA ligase, mitochondrial [Ceratosolen solmsi marchali]|uniref:Probable arginine--tRNA ligase, mitochondrial n=1 Tax=Ceratosolen solmsi marchali TaxID=326594 RepID=A0AAJ6YHL2_9HYME|nr:PREDICTED: probable arginine--tRNA ligase, mitochondrial [Ceratosolen solmsi marchali]
MCHNLRSLLYKTICQGLQNNESTNLNIIYTSLRLEFDNSSKKFYFAFPLRSKYHDIRKDVPNILKNKSDRLFEYIESVKNDSKEIHFQLYKNHYIKELLESLNHKITAPNCIYETPSNVVVEFSSPNIAKPFHVGHLRSTIIGNYITNINKFFNNNIKTINYLGDWGTQFGYVGLGLSLCQISDEAIKKDPINVLYNAYVYANKLAETDATIADRAREIFKDLENGNESSLKQWKAFKKYTLEELTKIYERIGIKFDEYQWESAYNIKEISSLISEIKRLDLLSIDSKDRTVINLNEKRIVPIIKSDGSSLYITRDIAAAVNRYEQYKFDIMYYVVDNTQTDHFINLIEILNAMKLTWANKLKHIKFGKIKGMSTRKGTSVFLQDLLNEIQAVMKQKQIQSPNTKINLNYNDPSTEILGLSAVIINDLRHKRNQDYEFDWNKALDIRGDSGIKLQYTHSRLASLEENSGATIASECIPSLLTEPEAENLIYYIGIFDEALIKSYQKLEPYILVNYLFQLSRATNTALKALRIKDEPTELANQRLLLMCTSRKVLAQGMKLLGLTPLNKM